MQIKFNTMINRIEDHGLNEKPIQVQFQYPNGKAVETLHIWIDREEGQKLRIGQGALLDITFSQSE